MFKYLEELDKKVEALKVVLDQLETKLNPVLVPRSINVATTKLLAVEAATLKSPVATRITSTSNTVSDMIFRVTELTQSLELDSQ